MISFISTLTAFALLAVMMGARRVAGQSPVAGERSRRERAEDVHPRAGLCRATTVYDQEIDSLPFAEWWAAR